ncbi:MAG TPA: hypothetical protein VID73_11590, partial [Ktedonobacterales bacterium]
TPFVQGVADASGRLTIGPFRAPNTGCAPTNPAADPNITGLYVAQTADLHARASLLFTYAPAPVVNLVQDIGYANEEDVTTNQMVALAGANWEPDQQVTLTSALLAPDGNGGVTPQPLTGDARSALASADGTFTLWYGVPRAPVMSRITLIASASGPRNGDVRLDTTITFTIAPSVAPTLSLSSAPGLDGMVTLAGANWPPDTQVQIEYCRGHPPYLIAGGSYCDPQLSQGLTSTTTDAAGKLLIAVALPGNARPGPITIQAQLQGQVFTNMAYDAQARPWDIPYPWAQVHPRLAFVLRALPYAIGALALALVIALIALGMWLDARRGWGRAA